MPISFNIWVIPYVENFKDYMVTYPIFYGNTFYVIFIFILSSIIQFLMGYHFYVNAYKSIKHKSANMDVLIATSASAAWLYGFILILTGYSAEEIKNVEMY
jgi:Cu+-exporting ATPase